MDPDETLKRIAALLRKAQGGIANARYEPNVEDADELYELVGSLVRWMDMGGFPPKRWAEALNHGLELMQLSAAGTSKALDSGTWGVGWRTV